MHRDLAHAYLFCFPLFDPPLRKIEKYSIAHKPFGERYFKLVDPGLYVNAMLGPFVLVII